MEIYEYHDYHQKKYTVGKNYQRMNNIQQFLETNVERRDLKTENESAGARIFGSITHKTPNSEDIADGFMKYLEKRIGVEPFAENYIKNTGFNNNASAVSGDTPLNKRFSRLVVDELEKKRISYAKPKEESSLDSFSPTFDIQYGKESYVTEYSSSYGSESNESTYVENYLASDADPNIYEEHRAPNSTPESLSEKTVNEAMQPKRGKNREIMRVRFVSPKGIVIYDPEEPGLSESEFFELNPKGNKSSERFGLKGLLKYSWRPKKEVVESVVQKNLNGLLGSYERSCSEYSEPKITQVVQALKDSIKNMEPLSVLKLNKVKGVDKCPRSLSDLIERFRRLRVLELEGCGLSDEFVKILSYTLMHSVSLESVNISNNPGITCAGLKYLSSSLFKIPTLNKVNFSGIPIKREGSKWLSNELANIPQRTNGSDFTLVLDNCSFNMQALERILDAVKNSNVTRLYLRKNGIGKQYSLAFRRFFSASNYSSLASSSYNSSYLSCTESSDSPISPVVSTSRLKFLDLSHNELSSGVSNIFSGLGNNIALETLVLRDTSINCEILASISNKLLSSLSLTLLDLSKNPLSADSSSNTANLFRFWLSRNISLKRLVLESCGINDEISAAIAESILKQNVIEGINLSNNPHISVNGIRPFARVAVSCPSFVSLKVSIASSDTVGTAVVDKISACCHSNAVNRIHSLRSNNLSP
ncbi:NACHT, LRR and PYD domains-containing protein 5 [Zancudomyces culisetae]|uniref:NACHT, LRR and PYD domains-containing protein 5 n=1 Tax=Zancudomyces culisetae TaxID=1213189 RepID=A0A1R1PJL4_ZANCU|nr:NACHT, LRR and PYD domains-containing protein 5 [Zancudomyces culisetae]|eukprot:OMH81156.1 NACHT, LRR and PYD domains-containing protein 5 [Zancudomyces culisetae]